MTALAHEGHHDGAAGWGWTFHGVPLVALLVAAAAYAAVLARQPRRTPAGRVVAWYLGLGVVGVALFSPLDAYGEEHAVSAHMLQHELLLTIAPVLLVAGLDQRVTLPLTRAVVTPALRTDVGRRVLAVLGSPVFATALWVVVVLGWHLPAVYDAALDDEHLHVAQHSSLIAAGIVFWVVVIGRLPSLHRTTVEQRIAALGVAMAASGVLGAALIWSNTVVYSQYADADAWFGLSPLQDQRLAGAVMMALDMPVLLGALGWVVARWARRQPHARIGERVRPGWPPPGHLLGVVEHPNVTDRPGV